MSYLYFITDNQLAEMDNDQLKLLLLEISNERERLDLLSIRDEYYDIMINKILSIEHTIDTYYDEYMQK